VCWQSNGRGQINALLAYGTIEPIVTALAAAAHHSVVDRCAAVSAGKALCFLDRADHCTSFEVNAYVAAQLGECLLTCIALTKEHDFPFALTKRAQENPAMSEILRDS